MPDWLTAILAIPHLHTILIVLFLVLLLISVFGNIGVDLKEKKITFGSLKKRSCGDCINILMAKRTGFEVMYNTKRMSILRQQMVFVEHKLIEIEQIIGKEIHNRVKDEIRRSFKENGFLEMSETDYDNYLNDRYEVLLPMIDTQDIKIPPIIKDIYTNAKAVKLRVETEIKKLEEDFINDMDEFVKVK